MRGMRTSFHRLGVVIGMGLGVAVAGIAAGGELDPPPGAIAPTMKTLEEVEARIALNDVNTPGSSSATYEILEPGSYYLTENLIGETGKSGVAVRVEGVTIDLNGFSVIGEGPLSFTRAVDYPYGKGTLRNGSVRGWTWGVHGEEELVVERVRFDECGEGISAGESARVSDCEVVAGLSNQDASIGIHCGENSIVDRCIVVRYQTAGISMDANSTCARSTARDCGSGFNISSSTIVECVASMNDANGIYARGCLVRDCVSRNNGGYGYFMSNGTLVDCVANSNWDHGVYSEGTVSIRGCNIAYNQGMGIVASEACVIEDCSILQGGSSGIELESGSGDTVVRECRVSGNDGWGIRVRDRCLVENNLITRNGVETTTNFAGLLVLGEDTVVRGNVIVGNDVGTFDGGTTNVWIDNVIQNNTPLP